MASNTILRAGDVFAMGHCRSTGHRLAVYDTAYTERYMQTPDLNPEGYDDSPMALCTPPERPFPPYHGTADDHSTRTKHLPPGQKFTGSGKDFDNEFS